MKRFYWIIPFIPQTILRVTAKILVSIFLRPKIFGLENLEKIKGSFILASNHTNEFDPVILLSAFPFKSFFRPVFFVSMAKKYYLHKGFRGRFIYGGALFELLGAKPVYFNTGDFGKSLINHTKVLENGGVTYIFPEGRVKLKKGEIEKKAKGGVVYLSHRTKKDILPVFIRGVDESGFWKDLFSFKRTMLVFIGTPISHEEVCVGNNPSRENYEKSAQRILDKINSLDLHPKSK